MKRLGIVLMGLWLALAFAPVAQAADVTASGRAFGAAFELGGEPGFAQSDTGLQSANAPGTFDAEAPADPLIPASPLLEVISAGRSVTGGVADVADANNNSSAQSHNEGATARVLVSQVTGNDLLTVVTSGANAELRCIGTPEDPAVVAQSGVNLLVIAGSPAPVPAECSTILAPELPLIRTNCSYLTRDFDTNSVSLLVEAVHVQAITASEVFDYVQSSAFAELDQVPSDCDALGPNPLNNSQKIARDDNNNNCAEVNELVHYTIRATNSGTADLQGVVVRDRIPNGMTLVAGSNSPTATVGPCPGDVSFTGCPGETASDTSRVCLTYAPADIAAGETVNFTFDARVSQDTTGFICNTARVGNVSVTAIVAGPGAGGCPDGNGDGNGNGGGLITTGSGGCSIDAGPRSRLDMIPVLALGVWLWLRRRSA